jgi:hypothetical protein
VAVPPDPPFTVGAPRASRREPAARLLVIMETMHAAGRRTLPPVPRVTAEKIAIRVGPVGRGDAAQQYVERLRSAAPDFAEAAGATSAVVREAVPPARHRRARCRVVLRYADDTEADVTFLGSTGTPGTPSRHGFDRQIRRWLGAGQRRDDAWLVPDPEASDGVAVDLNAWLAAG